MLPDPADSPVTPATTPTGTPSSVAEPDAATVAAKGQRSAMFIVFLVVFIDLLGFGIVLPLLPRYAKLFLEGFTDTQKGAIIGGIYSSFSLMQFIFSPMWGRMSDRIGRRPILMLGLLGSVLFYGLFGYASTLTAEAATFALVLLLLSRVGAGIAGASVGTAAAVIADCTTKETRAKGMALIGAAFGIGFTFGPLIAYASLNFLDSQPWAPGVAASALSALALVLAAVLLPETLKPGPKPPREFFSLSRTKEVLNMPTVGLLVLIYFLAIFAFANFEGTLALFTKEAFDMSDDHNFLVFAFIGFVLMMVQGGVYRPMAGKRSEVSLMKFGIAMMLIGLAGLSAVAVLAHYAPTTPGIQPLFYLTVAIAVAGFAFVNPSVSALVSKRADPARQGEVLGVNQAFSSLGRICGPFLGSVVFYQEASRVLPYAVASVVLLGVVSLLPRIQTAK